jgi:hypothetical protein
MVDPNPLRGLPPQLRRYWLVGKGAAKIRWNVPHDFYRCVRLLRKYAKGGAAFSPEGLCNILHREATGGAPGHGSLEHPGRHAMDAADYELALTAAAQLMQAQPLSTNTWVGPIAPIGRPTGEPRRQRVFDPGSLAHRPLPIPLAYQRTGADGHAGAVTVGRVLGMTQGPDENGNDCCFAWGDWLDPSIVPEVTEAMYLVDQGVVGPSVDPGGPVVATANPDTGAEHMQQYTIGRVTLVPIPAFTPDGAKIINLQDHEWPEDDQDMPWDQGPEDPNAPEQPGEPAEAPMPMMPGQGAAALEASGNAECGCGKTKTAMAMPMPMKPANCPTCGQPMPDGQCMACKSKMAMASPKCPTCGGPMSADGCMACKHKPTMAADLTYSVNADGWRGLPLAPRKAVFDADSAIARISQWAGVDQGHPDVAKLNRAFLWRDDSKPATDPTSYRLPIGDIINGNLNVMFHAIYAAAALISGAHGGLPDVPDQDKNKLRPVITNIYSAMAKDFNDSSIQAPWDRGQQMGMDMTEFAATPQQPYGQVQYADPGYQKDKQKRYPIDSEAHVRAAWAYINQADNAALYNPKQLAAVKRRIMMAAKKYGIQIAENEATEPKAGPAEEKKGKPGEFAMATGVAPLEPPSRWFADPKLPGKTRLTVTPEGRVFGHLAAWDECHSDLKLQKNQCFLAPKSKIGYAAFNLGEVYCSDGVTVPVGKIVMDTRHADISLGYSGAAIHYDNTGDEVAVVRAGEDQYGIWVAGAIVPEATSYDVAKLRRSPLSGDWRRVGNGLELTAALAVNVPAFPIYSMDGDETTALVAAGVLLVGGEEFAAEDADLSEEQDDRRWRLLEILDDEETFAQSERAHRLFALLDPAAPVDPGIPVDPNAAPVDQSQVPGQTVSDELAMESNCLFSVVEDTPGASTPDQLQPVK